MEITTTTSKLRIMWVGELLPEQPSGRRDDLLVCQFDDYSGMSKEYLEDPPDAMVLSLPQLLDTDLRSIEEFCAKLPYVPLFVLTDNIERFAGLSAIRHGAQDVLTLADLDYTRLERAILMGMERQRLRGAIGSRPQT